MLTVTEMRSLIASDPKPAVSAWELIAKQEIEDGSEFNNSARTDFLENENNSTLKTFMKIGLLTPNKDDWKINSAECKASPSGPCWEFKIVWGGSEIYDIDNKEIVWTQRSWLEESTIIDFKAIEGASLMPSGNGKNNSEFKGLGKSTYGSCVIDGDGSLHGNWWNCIGVVNGFQSPPAIPGPNGRKAYRNHLNIWKPGD